MRRSSEGTSYPSCFILCTTFLYSRSSCGSRLLLLSLRLAWKILLDLPKQLLANPPRLDVVLRKGSGRQWTCGPGDTEFLARLSHPAILARESLMHLDIVSQVDQLQQTRSVASIAVAIRFTNRLSEHFQRELLLVSSSRFSVSDRHFVKSAHAYASHARRNRSQG